VTAIAREEGIRGRLPGLANRPLGDAPETCGNCDLYSGNDGAIDGPCPLFQDKLVSANGWCTAWAGL